MIEIVLTLGGFLGIIIALQQDALVAEARTSFSILVVLFIIFAFFAYSALSIPLSEERSRFFVRGLLLVFGAMLALALTIPSTSGLAEIFTLTEPYIGVAGGVIAYLCAAFVMVSVIYYLLGKAFQLAFERMTPSERNGETNSDYSGG